MIAEIVMGPHSRLAMRNLDNVLRGRRVAALLNPEVWERRR